MNAAKENFLFRGYYKRKEKEAEKIRLILQKKDWNEQKEIDKKKN